MRLFLLPLLLLPVAAWADGAGEFTGQPKETPAKPSSLVAAAEEALPELDHRIISEVLSIRREEGMPEHSGTAWIRLTNPNPYPVFFLGNDYGRPEGPAVGEYYTRLEGDSWVLQERRPCGAGYRSFSIPSGGSVKVEVGIASRWAQQIIVTFHTGEDPPLRHMDQMIFERP